MLLGKFQFGFLGGNEPFPGFIGFESADNPMDVWVLEQVGSYE